MGIKHKPQRYDSPTRYIIPSSKKGQVHLIDLTSYDYNGECSCEDFTCVKIKAVAAGEPPSNKTRCKHIIYVRDCVADIFIAALHASTEISHPNNHE